jgi:hypothetical protein
VCAIQGFPANQQQRTAFAGCAEHHVADAEILSLSVAQDCCWHLLHLCVLVVCSKDSMAQAERLHLPGTPEIGCSCCFCRLQLTTLIWLQPHCQFLNVQSFQGLEMLVMILKMLLQALLHQ